MEKCARFHIHCTARLCELEVQGITDISFFLFPSYKNTMLKEERIPEMTLILLCKWLKLILVSLFNSDFDQKINNENLTKCKSFWQNYIFYLILTLI